MAKKTGKLIEKLRTDVQGLSEAIWALKEQVRVEAAAEAAANGSRQAKSRKLDHLDHRPDGNDSRGVVSNHGAFRTRDRSGVLLSVQWQQEEVTTESLIPDDLEHAAEKLSAIGHRQRLGIILALLEQPASAGELVATLDLGTTGAAYHHLNVLQNAGLVVQQERGTYELAPSQLGTVIGILAALATDTSVEQVEEVEAAAGTFEQTAM